MLRLLKTVSAVAVRRQVTSFAVASPARCGSSASVSVDEVAAGGADAAWLNARPYAAIPGPRPLPVLGNAWRFMPVVGEYYGKNIVEVMGSMMANFGTISRLSGMPGRPDLLVIGDPALIDQVMRGAGPWPLRKGADTFEYFCRNMRKHCRVSLITSQGKEWHEYRTAVNQVLMQPRNIGQYVGPIDSVGQEFVDRMRTIRDDALLMPDDFNREISKWAFESIAYVAMGTRLDLLKADLDPDSDASRMIQAIHTVFETMYELDFMPSLWKFVATPTYGRFIEAISYFTDLSTKYVNRAMDRLKDSPSKEQLNGRSFSVLETILRQSDDRDLAVAIVLDMLFGGIDTTSTCAATIMYQLATHPDKQRKLQAELDRVITDPSQPVTKEQLEEMKYFRAVIKETMRTMPVTLGNSRTTPEDMVVGGYRVPGNTICMLTYRGVYDNEAYFPRAAEFLPERWLPGSEDLKCKHPFAFLPFGFGVRMCVAKRFAELQMETMLAKVKRYNYKSTIGRNHTFRNFTLSWDRPPVKTDYKLVLRFVEPLRFTVEDREGA